MAKIGLDIGHGKNTFPSNGKGVHKNGKGYAEFDFNQRVGRLLYAMLVNAGHTIILGQPFDSNDVPLSTRTNKYNKADVDLVASIHADANNSDKANGRYYFYWHTDTKGKRLAQAIAKHIRAKGYDLRTEDGSIASVPGTWTNFHMVRETKAPAILGENGFMTGNKDFDLIFGAKKDKYALDVAEAYYKGIQEYLGLSTIVPKINTASSKPAASSKVSYPEDGVFYPNDTIKVRDNPSTKATLITRYYKGEHVTYHTVHQVNGYVWLQYDRSNGKQGYIPCREYKGGVYGPLWGYIV